MDRNLLVCCRVNAPTKSGCGFNLKPPPRNNLFNSHLSYSNETGKPYTQGWDYLGLDAMTLLDCIPRGARRTNRTPLMAVMQIHQFPGPFALLIVSAAH